MKKAVTILVTIGFIVTAVVPTAGAGGRGYGHHHPRGHVHYRYYHSSHDNFWIGLGLGVITGAIISSFHYSRPAPRRVVYDDPPPVAVRRHVSVRPPKSYGKALTSNGQVIVTAAELNMRSGPGLDRAVLGRVRKGDVLAIIDSIPNWFYIRTAKGNYGWVMDRYTKPAGPVG